MVTKHIVHSNIE